MLLTLKVKLIIPHLLSYLTDTDLADNFHSTAISYCQIFESLWTIRSCGTDSNALAKSRNIMSVWGVGPRVAVSTAAFHARVRGLFPGFGGLKDTKLFLPPSTREIQYCGEPPWPRGGVIGLRPPGFEFRILCLEGSVISPSSGDSTGQVQPICAQTWPKARFISFL